MIAHFLMHQGAFVVLILSWPAVILLIVVVEVNYHQGHVVLAAIIHGLLRERISDLSVLHALSA